MTKVSRNVRAARLAALLAVALASTLFLGACAKNPLADAGSANASAATPGSQQDFVVNVGDRVFFSTDSTELSPQSIATLDKQAQWLRTYSQYTFTIDVTGRNEQRIPTPSFASDPAWSPLLS